MILAPTTSLSPMLGFSLSRPIPALSVSSLDTFARCPRRFFYKYMAEIDTETHVALKFGEAIHAAIPLAHQGKLAESILAFKAVWGELVGDEKRNLAQAALILADYSESHSAGRSLFTLVEPPKGISSSPRISPWEVPFIIDIGLPLLLTGRIDGIGRHRDTKKLWGLEYKTSSEMSTRFFEGFLFSPQIVIYTMVLRAYGIPVEGVIVEGLKVSTAKKDAQGTITQPIMVTDHMVTETLKWIRRVGQEILAMQELQDFPINPSACTTYPQYGSPGYQCQYMQLCMTEDWTRLKDLFYHSTYPTFEDFRKTQERAVEVSEPLIAVTVKGASV